MTSDTMTPEMRHFVQTARRGLHPAASGGEQRVAAIVSALVDNCYGIDSGLSQSLIHVTILCVRDNNAASELIHGN